MLLAASAAALTFAITQVAHGHEPPLVRDVVWRQAAGPVLVTNRGLLLGEADVGPFRLACAAAMSIGIGARYDVLATTGDVLYVGTSNGLLRTRDGGCSFEPVVPLDALLVSALTPAPDDRATFYVAAYDPLRGGLFVTHDSGATFTRLRPASDSEFASDVRIAPSRSERIYVAVETFGSAEAALYLDRSDDRGGSFTRLPVTLLPTEGDFELLDVAPDDPDVLLARAVDDDAMAMRDRLLVSRDGGATWTSSLTVKTLESARFGRSGASVWVTGAEGAWRSMDGAQSFEQVPGATRMSFAFERDGPAWLCGYYDSVNNGIGLFVDQGDQDALDSLFVFSEVESQVHCAQGAPTLSACVTQWHDWQSEILYGYTDGGVPDGALDAGAPDSDASMPFVDAGAASDGADAGDGAGAARARERSGCAIARIGDTAHDARAAFMWLGALLAFAMRRRAASREA